jgi:hypothetical protein
MSFSDINYWYLFRFFPTAQLGKMGGDMGGWDQSFCEGRICRKRIGDKKKKLKSD